MNERALIKRLLFASMAVALLSAAFVPLDNARATNAWGGYHWARTSNPFTVRLGDNVTGAWDPYLRTASTDWTKSVPLDAPVVAGSSSGKNCRPVAGRTEVCNDKYGKNGWLGVAQIWISGNHITQGTVKLNDTYFSTAAYNTPAWRNLVTCQEVGHIFGLNHQDENFANTPLGSCMDYANNPSPNQQPDQHDYDQLVSIYSHLDSTTTVAGSSAGSRQDVSEPPAWGKPIKEDGSGRPNVFERQLGRDERVITFVFWAQ